MDDLRLQMLLDKEAIKEVRYKFAQGLDYKDWSLLESLVLDELDTDFSAWGLQPQKMSQADFIGLFEHSFSREGLKTQHIYSNFRITVEGNQATCRSNFLGQHYIQAFAGGQEFFLRAEYNDSLIRTKEGWKLSAVKLSVFYVSGNPAILVS